MNKKQDWREEYRRLSEKLLNSVHAYASTGRAWKPIGNIVADIDDIQWYIESLLQQQREEVIEILENPQHKYHNSLLEYLKSKLQRNLDD